MVKKIPGKDILIALWITVITGIYVFYGLSYLTVIQRVNNLILSRFERFMAYIF
jgi:hypothetical protein